MLRAKDYPFDEGADGFHNESLKPLDSNDSLGVRRKYVKGKEISRVTVRLK